MLQPGNDAECGSSAQALVLSNNDGDQDPNDEAAEDADEDDGSDDS